MVSTLSIAFLIISAIICFMLPASVLIFLYRKEKISVRAALIGAAAFIISQIVLRIPMLTFLNSQMWYLELSTNRWFLALFLSLTAGLFEETARFIGLRYLLKDHLEWKNGIAFGLGHGGAEAIIIVGISLISNIVFSIMINAGSFDSYASVKLQSMTAQLIKNTLINTNPYVFLLPGLERVLAITAHIALTLVVLYGVMNKQNICLLYAVLLHALLDFPAVIVKNTLLVEGYVFIFALLSLLFIIKSRKLPGFYHDDTITEGLQ